MDYRKGTRTVDHAGTVEHFQGAALRIAESPNVDQDAGGTLFQKEHSSPRVRGGGSYMQTRKNADVQFPPVRGEVCRIFRQAVGEALPGVTKKCEK